MKKIMTLAAIFAAVMMGVTSCNPDDTKPEQKPDVETPDNGGEETPDNGGEETPDNGGEETPAAAITIDGDFSDWDALEGAVVATLPEGDVKYEQLKTFKMYADEEFIYIFCEYDPENTLVFVPYFDLDSNPATGNDSKWSGAGYEAKAEGSIYDESEEGVQGAPQPWDPTFYYYGEPETVLESGMATTSCTPVEYKNGNWAFEASILREILIDSYASAFPDTATDKFTVGMIQYNLDWDYIGQLPTKTLAEIEAGEKEPMLTVVLP